MRFFVSLVSVLYDFMILFFNFSEYIHFMFYVCLHGYVSKISCPQIFAMFSARPVSVTYLSICHFAFRSHKASKRNEKRNAKSPDVAKNQGGH